MVQTPIKNKKETKTFEFHIEKNCNIGRNF